VKIQCDGRGIPVYNLGARRGWVVNAKPRPLNTPPPSLPAMEITVTLIIIINCNKLKSLFKVEFFQKLPCLWYGF
jgi:hypothetical protein